MIIGSQLCHAIMSRKLFEKEIFDFRAQLRARRFSFRRAIVPLMGPNAGPFSFFCGTRDQTCAFLFLSHCLFIYLFVYLFICLFVYLFICLFVYLLFVYLFICLFVYLFICLFVYLFICLFVYLFIYLFIYFSGVGAT